MKIKRAIALTALVAAAAGISPLAVAQDSGWYIGAIAGQSNFKDCTAPNCDDSDTAIGVFGGYQFHKNFGAEVGYTDLGETSAPGFASAGVTGFELVGVGRFPISERFSLYGKLGFFRWDVDSAGQSDSGSDLTYALGVQWNFTKRLGFRAQYQVYKDVGDSATTGSTDVDVLGVGVVFKF